MIRELKHGDSTGAVDANDKPLRVGDSTGAVDANDKPLRVGDKVTFASGGVVWTVLGGYAAAVDLYGRRRSRYYVKPHLLRKVGPESKES